MPHRGQLAVLDRLGFRLLGAHPQAVRPHRGERQPNSDEQREEKRSLRFRFEALRHHGLKVELHAGGRLIGLGGRSVLRERHLHPRVAIVQKHDERATRRPDFGVDIDSEGLGSIDWRVIELDPAHACAPQHTVLQTVLARARHQVFKDDRRFCGDQTVSFDVDLAPSPPGDPDEHQREAQGRT